SAAAIFPVAIFLAALALFFATCAHASSGERDAQLPQGERTQAAQRVGGTPTASGGVADTGGAPAQPVRAPRGLRAASPAPAAAPRPPGRRPPPPGRPGGRGRPHARAPRAPSPPGRQ